MDTKQAHYQQQQSQVSDDTDVVNAASVVLIALHVMNVQRRGWQPGAWAG